MKVKQVRPTLIILLIIVISGCGNNKALKNDVATIADAMCKNIEIMNKLKAASPQDSVRINELQRSSQDLQAEMTILYDKFRQKYESRMQDSRFKKDYSVELRKAMLKCHYLSKMDRERFEKEIN